MFACERGKGSLTSPNAAAAAPRWAEDALPRSSNNSNTGAKEEDEDSNNSNTKKKKKNSGEFDDLRTDVVRKSPLEALYSAFSPLQKAIASATTPFLRGNDDDNNNNDDHEREVVLHPSDEVNEETEISFDSIAEDGDVGGGDDAEDAERTDGNEPTET